MVDLRLVAASYEVVDEVRSAPLPEPACSWAASFSPRYDFNREGDPITALESSTVDHALLLALLILPC